MAQLMSEKALNQVVSHMDGVRGAVHDEAKEGGRKSQAILARIRASTPHEKISGPAHITEVSVTQGDVDSFINLDGDNPMSTEFGHSPSGYFDPERYGRVTKAPEGLYIISRGSGLI